ncbi:hypothetical protein EDF56_105317 [Novosphingobium sp. PhB165]|nr:hypothetical protein EDF56_105317 [Novosphingobium sp. PhB165]
MLDQRYAARGFDKLSLSGLGGQVSQSINWKVGVVVLAADRAE